MLNNCGITHNGTLCAHLHAACMTLARNFVRVFWLCGYRLGFFFFHQEPANSAKLPFRQHGADLKKKKKRKPGQSERWPRIQTEIGESHIEQNDCGRHMCCRLHLLPTRGGC